MHAFYPFYPFLSVLGVFPPDNKAFPTRDMLIYQAFFSPCLKELLITPLSPPTGKRREAFCLLPKWVLPSLPHPPPWLLLESSGLSSFIGDPLSFF